MRASLHGIENCGQLRHADARDDAGGADRTGTDADLERVGARVDQRLGAFRRGDIAGDHRHIIGHALDPDDLIQHLLRMAMRRIDHDAVHARINQHLRAKKSLVADGGGGGDAQASRLVLAGGRMQCRLFDVLDRHQSDAAELGVDHQQLLDAILVQQAARLVLLHPLAHRDELLGHQLIDRLGGIIGKSHIAIGENAGELAGTIVMPALDHRDARNGMAAHQRQGVGQGLVGENGDRIDHHAAFIAFYTADFLGLLFRLQIAVDDADAASLRHGDGQPRLGDSIHGRGHDRQVQLDAAGETRLDRHAGRHDLGMTRSQQDVVERQCFGQIGDSVHSQLRRRVSEER